MQEDEHDSRKEIFKSYCGYHWKGLVTVLVPLAFSPILFLTTGLECRCLYLVIVMAIFWITEVIPLYVTSMIPIVALPLMGILDSNTTCKQYFQNALALFLGGLVVALAIEYCNLHKRLALRVILIVGCSPRRLLFGLLFVSMFISMWISNSATTAMMCPIIRAVLEELDSQGICKMYMEPKPEDLEKKKSVVDEEFKHPSRIAISYYLGVAYGATLGGCATLIGTATNLTFKGIYESRFANSTEIIDFPSFMIYCAPIMFIDTIVLFFFLQWMFMGLFRPNSEDALTCNVGKEGVELVKKIIQQKYKELGPMTMHEIQVMLLFVLMVVLLFTRKPGFFVGWAELMKGAGINSSMPMMMVMILLFMIPTNYAFCRFCRRTGPFTQKQTPSLIAWKFVQTHVPWGLVFLLGGGYALAAGSRQSGMAEMVGNGLRDLKSLPHPVIQLLCIIISVFATAFSSNVAICNIIVPVLAELAVAIEVHPLYLIYPAGIACSMAFHLPVSTPPNAIVSGYAHIKTKYMIFAGIGPTVTTILLLFLFGQTWHFLVYPNSGTFPEWAKTKVDRPSLK